MAGLGRVQQMFNRAIVGTLATLVSFLGRDKQAAAKTINKGHPLLAKYLKSNAPNANRPGARYPGYCAGTGEAARRAAKLHTGIYGNVALNGRNL